MNSHDESNSLRRRTSARNGIFSNLSSGGNSTLLNPIDKTNFSYQTMSLHFGWIIAQFNGLFVVSSFVCSFGTLAFFRTRVKELKSNVSNWRARTSNSSLRSSCDKISTDRGKAGESFT